MRQVKSQKLEQIEHLIGRRHNNLTDYLIQYFNHPAVSGDVHWTREDYAAFFLLDI